MYKVFVNEKELFFSKVSGELEKVMVFTGNETFEIGIDLLQNTSVKSVNIFYDDLDYLWKEFRKHIYAIEAAGGIVENDKDEILFIKRLGKWDLPKGKIEKNEAVDAAAVREITEETGVTDLKIEKFITQTYHIYKDRSAKNILKITHWYSMKCNENQLLVPQLEEGITEVRWINKKNINEMVYPSTFENIKLLLTQYI